jgi:hypothetical protein
LQYPIFIGSSIAVFIFKGRLLCNSFKCHSRAPSVTTVQEMDSANIEHSGKTVQPGENNDRRLVKIPNANASGKHFVFIRK